MSNQNNFLGTYRNLRIDGEFIIGTSYEGDNQIGYTFEAYQELEQLATEAVNKLDEYEKLLIENGLIEVEKTQEEINAELQEQLKQSIKKNEDLSNQIDNLTQAVTQLINNQQQAVQNEHSGQDERKPTQKVGTKATNNPKHKESVGTV